MVNFEFQGRNPVHERCSAKYSLATTPMRRQSYCQFVACDRGTLVDPLQITNLSPLAIILSLNVKELLERKVCRAQMRFESVF